MAEENPIDKEAGFFSFLGITYLLAKVFEGLGKKMIEYDPMRGTGKQFQLTPDPSGKTKLERIDQDGIETSNHRGSLL